MLCGPAYTHQRRPYLATLFPTSFTLDSFLALRIDLSVRLIVGVTPCALWRAGAFSFDCMFWHDMEGGLTGQPGGPVVGNATMRQ